MQRIFRFLHTGWRLGIGGILLPSALNRGAAGAEWHMLSVDVFGTLLARRGDDDAPWREGALRTAEVARNLGLAVGIEPVTLRRTIEREFSRARLAAGEDPEFSHQQVLEEMLRKWGAGQWATDRAAELAAWELEREIAFSRPIKTMTVLVRDWAAAGRRVVAVSDTRYSSRELADLLSSHGISGLSAIYASADEGTSKFSGKLFDTVARREGVELRHMLHVGDDIFTDALSAAERGLAVRRVPRPVKPESLPEAVARPVDCAEPAFSVGYRTLGPILVAFARLLIDRARRDGMRLLAFVARDGELLLRVTQTIVREAQSAGSLELKYLHLSRRAVACASPDLQRLQTDPDAVERILATLRALSGMGSVLESFQGYYNVPPELILHHAGRMRVEMGDETDLRRLLCDSAAATDLVEAFRPMSERLRRYLLQEKILCEHSALVDIGWRGSLQSILSSNAKLWELPAPHGYYLGLWNEDGISFPVNATGLITDQRRGRGLHEGSGWHAAFLLEAVCRAKHGTVTGFLEATDARIKPVHVEKGGTRDAERDSERTQVLIQSGVLAYAEWFAETYPITVADEVAIRRAAQRKLYKLAFFPTRNERETGRSLVYSSPTSDSSALSLIASAGTGLSGWVAGMRSPWKGGYLRANGGGFAAGVYCAAEGLVSKLPLGTKTAIRRLLIPG